MWYRKVCGIVMRNQSMAQRLKHQNTTNDLCFAKKTNEALYWVGFLMADGSIIKGGRGISLGLGILDKEQVDKFRNFVNASSKTYIYKNAASAIIHSKRIAQDLSRYGVVERKSKIAKASNDVCGSRDFWRGVIDGDGSIGTYATGDRISLTGSKFLCSQFLEFVQKYDIAIKAHVSNYIHNGSYEAVINGAAAKAAIKLLYENAKFYLERKMQSAQLIINAGQYRRGDISG